jgi:hypothetical protein
VRERAIRTLGQGASERYRAWWHLVGGPAVRS